MKLPTLNQLAPNFHNIESEGVVVWFSYATMIAFSVDGFLYCRENEWGPTTGKHLNTIEPDKSRRLTGETFEKRWWDKVYNGTVYTPAPTV